MTEDNKIQVVACPHPLKEESLVYIIEPNKTITEVIKEIQPDEELGRYVNVWLNDQIILPGMYDNIVIKETDKLYLRYTLQGGGGGGNKVLNTALMIGVLALAMWAGPLAGAFLFGATTTTAAGTATAAGVLGASAMGAGITSAITMTTIGTVGSMVVNSLVPPYVTEKQSYGKVTYSLESASNSMNRFSSIPVVLGRHRVYPVYCATPYTERVGEDQYLRALLNWGYGPMTVYDIRIGGTPISAYNEVEHQFRSIYQPDDPFTLYPSDVEQTNVSTVLNTVGESVTRTTSIGAEEITIDIAFPSGLQYTRPNSGKKTWTTRSFSAQYRKKGDVDWLPFLLFGGSSSTTISANTQTAFTKGYRYVFSEKGQYDIRITPLDNGSVGMVTSYAMWSTLISYNSGVPVLASDLCMSALRIRATDQLNGTITDLSGIASTICLDWDKPTQSWVSRETNNPASLFRYVLQGPFLNKRILDSQIDLRKLEYWHEYCITNNFTCNTVVASATSVEEILGIITSAGRATTGWIDGKRTVIIDEPKTAKQVVTPRNSWDFSLNKIFTDIPHAWRIPFSNEDKDWLTDEYIVYADGYDSTNAKVFETLSFEGVTNSNQIYKMGKYYHNVAKLRPETYTFSMDIENLVCNRGDVIIINHDVPAFGIKTARVKEVYIDNDTGNCTGVKLDDFVVFEEGRSYYLRNRFSDGSIELFNINNGYNSELNVETYTFTFVTPLEPIDTPNVGDLSMIGINEVETAELIIKNIVPANDLSATIEAVNYDENIYSVGPIPPFDSKITLSPEYYTNTPKGSPVTITSVFSDEKAALVTIDGSIQPRILINYIAQPNSNNVNISFYDIQWRNTANDFWNPLVRVTGDINHYYIDNVQEEDSVEIRVRSYASSRNQPGTIGQPSEWTYTTVTSVIGTTTVPPDLTSMFIENRHLSWVYLNKPVDFLGYEVRQLGGTRPYWSLGTVISNGLIPQAFFDITQKTYGQQIYMVKAVDRNGKYSNNFVYVIADFGPPNIENVKDQIDYQTDWLGLGTVVGGSVDPVNGWLVSYNNDNFWEGSPNNGLFWGGISDNYFWGGSYFDMYYTTNPYTIISDGYLTVLLEVESIYGSFLEYRRYIDGMADDEGWLVWVNTLEVIKGSVYQFRVSCYQGTNSSKIKSLSVINDTADQTEFFNDLIIPATGLRVPITKEYAAIKTVTYALQDDGNGGISVIVEDKNPILGPLIKILDDASSQVQGLIDITIYGIPKT